jgi:hypothetical protein
MRNLLLLAGGVVVMSAAAIYVHITQPVRAQSNCDPAYPTVCIPPPPPDLDCGDPQVRGRGYTNFEVRDPDPHRFDGDNDGIGCEPPP